MKRFIIEHPEVAALITICIMLLIVGVIAALYYGASNTAGDRACEQFYSSEWKANTPIYCCHDANTTTRNGYTLTTQECLPMPKQTVFIDKVN